MRFRKHTLYKKRKTRNKRIKTRRKMRHYRGGGGDEFASIKSKIEATITEIEPLVEKYRQHLTYNESLIKLSREYEMNSDSINSRKQNSIYNKAYAVLTQKPNSGRVLILETRQNEIEKQKDELKQTLSEQLPDIENLLVNLDKLIDEADKAKQEQGDIKYVYDSSKRYETYRSIVYTVNIFRKQRLYNIEVDKAKAEKAKAEKASEAVPINKLTSGLEYTGVGYTDH